MYQATCLDARGFGAFHLHIISTPQPYVLKSSSQLCGTFGSTFAIMTTFNSEWRLWVEPTGAYQSLGAGTGQSHEAGMAASWLDQVARAPKRVHEHYRRLKVKEELLEIAASSSASELVRAVGEVPSSVAEGHGVAAPLKTKWKKYRMQLTLTR